MSDPDNTDESLVNLSHSHCDQLLCVTFNETLRKSCLSSGQIKALLTSNHCSIINMILEQHPILSTILDQHKSCKNRMFLWHAIATGFYDLAEFLICSGADVNQVFECGSPKELDDKITILHYLMSMDPSTENERLIRLVLDHGADLRASNSKGVTALHLAVQENPELVPLLIKHGADVTAKTIDGKNVLHMLSYTKICDEKQVDLARTLIEMGASLDDREHRQRYQPIHLAAILEQNALVKLYLDYGANPNAEAIDGKSVLILAAKNDNPALLETLLKRGANIDLKTAKGSTALHISCMFSNEKNISLLSSLREDMLFVQNNNGYTPLRIALVLSIRKESSIMRPLLKKVALWKARLPSRLQLSIESNDETYIEKYPKFWNYYQDCHSHISRMRIARLFGHLTLFELLTNSHLSQIASLMRNPDFESNFMLYDLSEFSMYAEDISRAFKRAQSHYHSMLEQEDMINEAFYSSLPYVIVRKIVDYVSYDCCDNIMK